MSKVRHRKTQGKCSARTKNVEKISVICLLIVGGPYNTADVSVRVRVHADVVYGQPVLTVDLIILGVRVTRFDVEAGVAGASEDVQRFVRCSPGVRKPLDSSRRARRREVVATNGDVARCYSGHLSDAIAIGNRPR